MSEALSGKQIREVNDRPVEKVPCPEWGGDCYVRILSGLEYNQVRKFQDGDNILGNYAALLLCDAEGFRLFTVKDAGWLGQRDGNVLSRICEAGKIFNEITDEQGKKAAKN